MRYKLNSEYWDLLLSLVSSVKVCLRRISIRSGIALGGIFLFGIAAFLTGCSSSLPAEKSSYGHVCSIDTLNDINADLASDGVLVNRLGDYIYLTFSSDTVFPVASDHIKNTDVLDDVSRFLKCQQKISVHVIVYSGVLRNSAEDLAFSQIQAQRISKYLWKQGVDARLLTAKGAGQTNAGSPSGWVEISTQKLP